MEKMKFKSFIMMLSSSKLFNKKHDLMKMGNEI